MIARWRRQRAADWYAGLPYLAGANYYPSSASNQLEMWQAETWDPETITRELGWAADLGMNLMRVFLHNLVWENDRDGLLNRMDEYLDIAGSLGIRTSFVFFDDCWNGDFASGPQPEPSPMVHNSRWLQCPGWRVVNDPSRWAPLESYVRDIMERYGADDRVLYWDLYNEPGNGGTGDASISGKVQKGRSLPLLKQAFAWARKAEGVTQPVTAGVWVKAPGFRKLNRFQLENSDIISFHSYSGPAAVARMIRRLRRLNRPLVCTEYMARPKSTFAGVLPVLKEHRVAAINWGLVSGRSNTVYPWGWKASKGRPDWWFHDVFTTDGNLLYEEERPVIEGLLKKESQK